MNQMDRSPALTTEIRQLADSILNSHARAPYGDVRSGGSEGTHLVGIGEVNICGTPGSAFQFHDDITDTHFTFRDGSLNIRGERALTAALAALKTFEVRLQESKRVGQGSAT